MAVNDPIAGWAAEIKNLMSAQKRSWPGEFGGPDPNSPSHFKGEL